jgi:broad specificity phosphatase PhoE
MDYDKMTEAELREQFDIERKNWKQCPKKGSFSGLAISERCEKIQQIMDERGYDFIPLYMTINVDIG